MLWAVRQIFVPCNYLRIKHGGSLFQSKAVFDFVLPAIFTSATVGVCLWLRISLAIFKHAELVKHLLDLLALMIAFYMAALAAVATFERKGIDGRLKGEDATLRVVDHDGGHKVDKTLSYRQFISYLFGYLTFLSLCLFVMLVLASSAWPALKRTLGGYGLASWIFTRVAEPSLFGLTFFGLWQLIFTSFLGIYFLTERIQSLNDPER